MQRPDAATAPFGYAGSLRLCMGRQTARDLRRYMRSQEARDLQLCMKNREPYSLRFCIRSREARDPRLCMRNLMFCENPDLRAMPLGLARKNSANMVNICLQTPPGGSIL